MKRTLLTILLAILVCSCKSTGKEAGIVEYMNVVKIVDGDTFWADDGNEKRIKIRLIGVDAPESRNTGRKLIGYYGQQSKEYLTKMLTNKKVRLVYDVGRKDQYSRELAYVYLEDGTFVNAELVKEGYAMVMTVPPNVKYAELFVKLERRARNRNKGLWNEKHIEK
jgi:micrococcal nuclease